MTQFIKKKIEAGDKIGYSDIPKFRNVSAVTADGMSQEGLGPEEELPAGDVDFHREKYQSSVFKLSFSCTTLTSHQETCTWCVGAGLGAGPRQGKAGDEY